MKENRLKKGFVLLLACFFLTGISGCKAGEDKGNQKEQQAIIDDYVSVILAQDEDSAQFDRVLEQVGVYVEEASSENREAAKKAIEDAINLLEEKAEACVPYTVSEELEGFLENQGLTSAEYKINADMRYQYLQEYIQRLQHLVVYLEGSVYGEGFMEDLEFAYSCTKEEQKQTQAFQYTSVNYWFAPWGQEAYVKEQILDKLQSFQAEDFHWENSREGVEARLNLYLDRIENLAGEWGAHVWKSKERLYEQQEP